MYVTNGNESSLMDFRKASFFLCKLPRRQLSEDNFLMILSRDSRKDNRPQQHLGLYTQVSLIGLKT